MMSAVLSAASAPSQGHEYGCDSMLLRGQSSPRPDDVGLLAAMVACGRWHLQKHASSRQHQQIVMTLFIVLTYLMKRFAIRLLIDSRPVHFAIAQYLPCAGPADQHNRCRSNGVR
eukprot:5839163-Pleurochrysis_carterae.AAC.2